MKKFLNKSRGKGSFNWIKQNLNPAKSYIVFEKERAYTDDVIVFKNSRISGFLERSALKWQEVIEEKTGKDYLVIQTDPGEENSVLGEFLGQSALYDATYYIFKAEEEKRENEQF